MKGFNVKALIAFMVLALVLAACSSKSGNDAGSSNTPGDSSSSNQPAAEYRSDLVVAYNASPSTLDPHMNTQAATKLIARHIFETLVTLDSQYKPVPMLAESIEPSDDNKTFKFNLRQGVKFHNGKEMTSEDVVASMNRWKEKSGTAKTLGEVEFVAVDPYTVEMRLAQPSGMALNILGTPQQFPAIMPKEVIESATETGTTEFIGTGPFELVEWKKDQSVHLKKYADYKAVDKPSDGLSGKKEALVENIRFEIVTSPSTRGAGVQSGQYDIALSLPHDSYERMKNTKGVNAVAAQYYGGLYVYFNKKQGMFTDVNMRKAINLILNADEILLGAFTNKDLYSLSHNLMPQADWAVDGGKDQYNQQNLEEAKRLLAEAGYNGQEIRIPTTQDYPYFYGEAIVIKDQLEKAGLKVRLDVLDYASLSATRNDPTKWDIGVATILTRATPGELEFLQPNIWGWTEDPKIQEMLQAVNTAPNQEEMKQRWNEAQAYIWDTLPGIKFGDFSSFDATTDKVVGYKPFDGMILWNTQVLK